MASSNVGILAFEKSLTAKPAAWNPSTSHACRVFDWFCSTHVRARTWVEQNQSKTRQAWLVDGFQAAGFAVKDFSNASIPTLLDAIDGPFAISINAQLALKSLSKLHQDSLSWSTSDARWHYTRYFKRRAKKYHIDLSDRDEHGNKL